MTLILLHDVLAINMTLRKLNLMTIIECPCMAALCGTLNSAL